MSKLEQRFHEDRALRDAARKVLIDDIEHAKTSFSAKGVADRVGSRIGDGAVDVFETARSGANDNRGIIAALIGALLLWLGRQPILEALGLNEPVEDDAEADEATEESVPLAASDTPENDLTSAPGDDDEH